MLKFMTHFYTGASILVILLLVHGAIQDAQAQSGSCLPHAEVLKRFERGYGELPVMQALTSQGTVIEILMNLETRTWTMLATIPGGLTCFVGAGESFEFMPITEPLGPGA